MNAQPEPHGRNSISFIIPAWNEEAFVGATLAALRIATTSLSVPFEIIVVDDGSTDRTAEIAEALGAQVVKVTEEITMTKGLKRHGRFVLLPHYVVTSARKLQSISLGKSLLITLYAILGGSRFFRSRKSKEMYYGQR